MSHLLRPIGWAASILGAAIGARSAGLNGAEFFVVLTGLLAAFWAAEGYHARCQGC